VASPDDGDMSLKHVGGLNFIYNKQFKHVPIMVPGLDGPRIESRWGRDFPHLSRPVLGLTQPTVQWVPGLSRGKERPGRDADPSPPSSAVVMKE